MDQTVNIADLVKPKFNPGQRVWIVRRDYNGRIEGLYPVTISGVGFNVTITAKDGVERRTQTMSYLVGNTTYGAEDLIASLDELHPNERNQFQKAAA